MTMIRCIGAFCWDVFCPAGNRVATGVAPTKRDAMLDAVAVAKRREIEPDRIQVLGPNGGRWRVIVGRDEPYTLRDIDG